MMESDAPLTWDASYAIALALMEAHPDAVLDELSLQQLLDWVLALPNFVDDASLADDKLLMEILREWYEEDSAR